MSNLFRRAGVTAFLILFGIAVFWGARFCFLRLTDIRLQKSRLENLDHMERERPTRMPHLRLGVYMTEQRSVLHIEGGWREEHQWIEEHRIEEYEKPSGLAGGPIPQDKPAEDATSPPPCEPEEPDCPLPNPQGWF